MKMLQSTTNRILFGFGIFLLALLGYYFYAMHTSPVKDTKGTVTVSLEDNIRGRKNASVTLVEFGDFQCPACGAYEPLLREVLAAHPDDLRFVFRHFPLTQIHPNALLASKYTEAAGLQGKFWEMHDILYEKQAEWSGSLTARDFFAGYAGSLGLDVAKLVQDADLPAVVQKILAQYKEGVTLGIQGTPTFYLNGKKVEGSIPNIEAFNKLIEEAKKASSTPEVTAVK